MVKKYWLVLLIVFILIVGVGVMIAYSKYNEVSLRHDVVLPPDTLENVKFVVDFNDGKKYEALQDIINPVEKTISGYLKKYGVAYQLDIMMKFPMHPSEVVSFDSSDELLAIGTYANTLSRKWKCYLNGQNVPSGGTSLKSNDHVLCKYEKI